MQVVRNGTYAEIEEFTPESGVMKLTERNVDHIEVFAGTKKNIKERTAKIGTKYKVSKAYQKAPKIKTKTK